MISIIIPCYNEEQNLPRLGEKVGEVIMSSKEPLEVILVDNGSTDSSAGVLKQFAANDETNSIKIVSVEENTGYGSGIMAGVLEASGEIISWTHADLQTDLFDVVKAVERFGDKLSSGLSIVKGRRQGRGIIDVFFTFGMSILSSIVLLGRFNDVNAQPKVFHRSFLKHLEGAPRDFSLDLFFLYRAKEVGLSVEEIPVVFADRVAGEAKGGGSMKGKYKLVKRTISYIFELRRKIKST